MDWYDWYDPIDFFAWAHKLAAEFLEHRRGYAEYKQDVYRAAEAAAYAYELSDKFRKKHFETIVRLFIRTALIKIRKDVREMNQRFTPKDQDDWLKLYEGDESQKSIACRYGCTPWTINQGIKAAKEARAAKKETPEAAATASNVQKKKIEKNTEDIIAPSPENVKPEEPEPSEPVEAAELPEPEPAPAEPVAPPEPETLDTVDIMKRLAAALRNKDVGELRAVFRYHEILYRLTLEEVGR